MTSLATAPLTTTLGGYPLEPTGTALRRWSGSSHPFGASVTESGVNFALYSANATAVTLLLFNSPEDADPVRVIELDSQKNRSFNIWHVFIEGARHGMGYAYRVDGPHDPWNGHRFDPEKVLIDPYAKANNLSRWKRGDACFPGDNLHTSMRSVIIDIDDYDWEGDRPLQTPMAQSVIYEMHVGGFTKSPTSGVKNPGTFLGLIEKIPYLKQLGVTAVELLPPLCFDHTDVLREHDGKKLVNYWGYSTMGYFAPHQGYCVNADTSQVDFSQDDGTDLSYGTFAAGTNDEDPPVVGSGAGDVLQWNKPSPDGDGGLLSLVGFADGAE